jgi:hypothetical protein
MAGRPKSRGDDSRPGGLDIQGPLLRNLKERPFPPSEAFYRDPSRDTFAFCGVRAGKSYMGAEKAAARIVMETVKALTAGCDWKPIGKEPKASKDKPRVTFWVVAPTMSLTTLSWAMFRSVLQRVAPLIISEVDGEIWLEGGCLIQRKTGFDETQLQGAAVSGVWADEIATLPYASYLQIRNRLSDKEGWLIGTGSPRPDSWAKPTLWDARDFLEDTGIHHWTTEQNPWYPRKELERMRAMLPERWFKRDFMASWDTFEGLVYQSFDPLIHIIEPDLIPDEDMRWWGGQDWGWASPGCFLLIGQHVPTGAIYVVDEIYADRLPTHVEGPGESWVRRVGPIHEHRGLVTVYCDVSKGTQDVFHYRKAGIPARVTKKGSGSVIDGIKTVERLMIPHPETGVPQLRISSACRNLIREVRSYVYVCDDEGNVRDRIDASCADHALDALRYGIIGEFERSEAGFGAEESKRGIKPLGEWTIHDFKAHQRRQDRLTKKLKRNRF